MNETNAFCQLNPFIRATVGENEIWADEDQEFCDIGSINGGVFDIVRQDIGEVAATRESRVRFLVGPAGSGKSHLFARLRRKLNNEQFTFVPSPPTSRWEIKRYVLKKIIGGMKHPARDGDRILPYSQIERLVYALLIKTPAYSGCSVDEVHAKWKHEKRIHYHRLFEEFHEALQRTPGIDLPLPAQKALFRVLDEEKKWIALEWLAGIRALSDRDLSTLQVSGPLEDSDVIDLLKNFGRLAGVCGPMVLIFDQLDALRREEQIAEIEDLLIELKDSSENWYVIVSLLHEKFTLWQGILSAPFLGRFGTVENGIQVFRVAELSLIGEPDQRRLLLSRLASRKLSQLRLECGIESLSYPLDENSLRRLLRPERVSPRFLLQEAELEYRKATLEGTTGPGGKEPLRELILNNLAELRASLEADDIQVDAAYISDRIAELFEILHFADTGMRLTSQEGPLRNLVRNFEGSDRIYELGEKSIRVVGYDVQQGRKFPDILKKIVHDPPTTILVRDGRVRFSGQATRKYLDAFRLDKEFLQLSEDAIKDLHTVGRFLAKMREGDFQNSRTDPEPSEENILKGLSEVASLAELPLAHAFRRLLRGGKRKRDPDPPPPTPDTELMTCVQEIMRAEGWLCVERLFYRVCDAGFTELTLSTLSSALRSEPLSSLILVYPVDPIFPEPNRILIWNEEL